MKIEVCDKCGKRIKGNVNTVTYKSMLKFSHELEFCDECFDEIVKYKKQVVEEGRV